jgi:hypothetical protein
LPPKVDLNFSAIMELAQNGQFEDSEGKIRGRVRICFADEKSTLDNRVITKTALESLMKSLPTIPVVGSFDESKSDFTTHQNVNKRKYGYIPEEPNVAYEVYQNHLFLSSDVILTSMSENIIGNPQSLEIDENTVKGHWDIVNGKAYFFFTYAEFSALCVLGKDVTPAFTGAEFYPEGGSEFNMNKNKFKASWNEQARKVADAAYSKIAGEFYLDEIYDDAVIVYSWDEDSYLRIPFTMEGEEYSFGEKISVRNYFITAEEESMIDQLRNSNAQFEEQLKEKTEQYEKITNDFSELLKTYDITVQNNEGEFREFTEIKLDFDQTFAVALNEKLDLEKQLNEVKTQFADAQINTEFETQIADLQKEKVSLEAELQKNSQKIALFEKLEKEYISLSVAKFDKILTEEEKAKLTECSYADFKLELADLLLAKNFEKTEMQKAAFTNNNNFSELPDWAQAVVNRTSK